MTIHHYYPQSMQPIPDTAGEWQGLNVQTQNGALNEVRLLRIRQLVQDACSDAGGDHSLYAYQFSLMIDPELGAPAFIDQFMNVFVRQFVEDLERRSRLDNRRIHFRVRCIWMEDQLTMSAWSYRVLIIMPSGAYQALCEPWKGNTRMMGRLIDALMVSASLSYDEATWRIAPLVFPRLKFNVKGLGVSWEYQKLFYLASIYAFAPMADQDNQNSFGCRLV